MPAWIRAAPTLAALLLLATLQAVASSSNSSGQLVSSRVVKFASVRARPASLDAASVGNDTRQVQGASSPASCQVECSIDLACHILFHLSDTCWLGNLTAWTSTWQANSSATSFLKRPTQLLADLANYTELLLSFSTQLPPVHKQQQPVLVNKSQVTEGSHGLRFYGNSTSYVDIGQASFLQNLTGDVTFFAKVMRQYGTTTNTNRSLFSIYNAEMGMPPAMEVGGMYEAQGNVNFFYRTQRLFSSVDQAMPRSNTQKQLVSVAVVMNTMDVALSTLYVSGVQRDATQSTHTHGSAAEDTIRLGHSSAAGGSGGAFVGEFLCFAIFSRALTGEEVRGLDTVC